MNIKISGFGAASFGQSTLLHGGFCLKSTQQKLERQKACSSKVEFFENQKQNLKNMKCDSFDDIAQKLEMFHSYEDQIIVAKMEYNNEQMWHVMDEAQELAEKIAEKAKEAEAKTPEERREEQVKEALGIDVDNGILEKSAEGLTEEITEELTGEITEETVEEAMEKTTEEITGEITEEALDGSMEEVPNRKERDSFDIRV